MFCDHGLSTFGPRANLSSVTKIAPITRFPMLIRTRKMSESRVSDVVGAFDQSARLTAATTEQILCIVSTLPHFSLCTDTVYTTHASSPTVLTSHLPVLFRSTVHSSAPYSLHSLLLYSYCGDSSKDPHIPVRLYNKLTKHAIVTLLLFYLCMFFYFSFAKNLLLCMFFYNFIIFYNLEFK